MAEETHGARRAASMGLVHTCAASGLCGLVYLLGLLLATRDVEGAIDSVYGNAAVAVFVTATGPRIGAVLAWLIVANLWFSGVSRCA